MKLWDPTVVGEFLFNLCSFPAITLLGTSISPQKGTFEDDFPFPPVGFLLVPWRVPPFYTYRTFLQHQAACLESFFTEAKMVQLTCRGVTHRAKFWVTWHDFLGRFFFFFGAVFLRVNRVTYHIKVNIFNVLFTSISCFFGQIYTQVI